MTDEQLEQLRRTPVGATGNRIQAAIDLLGSTQTALAKEALLPYTYVSDVARGRYLTITLHKAHRFAAAFGCLIEDLFPSPAGTGVLRTGDARDAGNR